MRNLTIHRMKTFVGCMAKMKVYIEDPEAGELDINGVLCRKIGELKNGEEKTFVITQRAVKVYVIAGTSSRNFCNDYCTVPEGTEDVHLTGKNRYNPANGNAFRFDGIHDDEVKQNRKKGFRKGLVILIASCLVGLVVGVVAGLLPFLMQTPKTFTADEMQITLHDGFTEVELENVHACYATKEVVVFAIKEAVADAPMLEGLTLEEYGELVLDGNLVDESIQLQKVDGLTCFEYLATNPDNGVDYIYFSVVYQSADAYWLVQFATPEEKIQDYSRSFVEWAKSVAFTAA